MTLFFLEDSQRLPGFLGRGLIQHRRWPQSRPAPSVPGEVVLPAQPAPWVPPCGEPCSAGFAQGPLQEVLASFPFPLAPGHDLPTKTRPKQSGPVSPEEPPASSGMETELGRQET